MLSDFWLGIENLKNAKHLKKKISEELIPITRHPKRWWIFACQKMKKKKQNQFLLSSAFNVYNLRVLGHFRT